jgi:myo-inositol-1(or 4)-monophosphatase
MTLNDVVPHLLDLAARLREVVLPSLGLHAARTHAGAAVGGDVTFDIDEKAEVFLARYMAAEQPRWAYYSEDRGLQGAAHPDLILVVDPIDGTRPAAAGFESACVSVAAVPASSQPTMGDVVAGVIHEIKSGDVFAAEKGAGVEMRRPSGETVPLLPSTTADIETMFWTLGFRGRPALVLAGVLEELIDRSSVGGCVFDLGSATYCITRILTGQLDAYVDVGPAIIAAHPATESAFRRVGRGHVLNNSPYDLAAAYLIVREAGLPIADAAGGSLDSRPLLGSDHSYQMACIAASNDELQAKLISAVQRALTRYKFAS